MTGVTTTEDRRELAHRMTGGVDVALLWDPQRDVLSVVVADAMEGTFELVLGDGDRAMDVFHHPYAYAALRGLDVGLPSGKAELAATA
jgi:hypothetical protein